MKFQKKLLFLSIVIFFGQVGQAGNTEAFYYDEDGTCVVSRAALMVGFDVQTFSVAIDTKNKETPSQAFERAKKKAREEMCALTPSKGKAECEEQLVFPYEYQTKTERKGLFRMVSEVTEVCVLARIDVQAIKSQQEKKEE